jgi:hypothetical protein
MIKPDTQRVIHYMSSIKHNIEKKLIKKHILTKILYLLVVLSFLFFILMPIFKEEPFFLILFYIAFSGSVLGVILITELCIFFSKSVLDGTPKKPTMDAVGYELVFLLAVIMTFFAGQYPVDLLIPVILIVSVIFFAIFEWMFPSQKVQDVKYSTAGRIFTYTSLSTVWYLTSAAFLLILFLETYDKILQPGWEILGFSINLEVVLIIFFLVPTIIFFLVKESIFDYYGHILSKNESKKKNLCDQKKSLANEISHTLDAAIQAEPDQIDLYSKKIEFLEKKIAYTDQKIKKIQNKFEFHKLFKLNIAFSPIWILIVNVLKDTPLMAEIFEEIGSLLGL